MYGTEYEIKIHGDRLLMNNCRSANPFDEYAIAKKTISKKKGKTEQEVMELAKIDFQSALHFDDTDGPVIPAINLFAMMKEAASPLKLKSAVERGVGFSQGDYRLEYEGPRTREELWSEQRGGQKAFAHAALVRIPPGKRGKLILKTRPLFRNWEVSFRIFVDPKSLDDSDIVEIMDRASMSGLGDGRPFFGGKFQVVSLRNITTGEDLVDATTAPHAAKKASKK